MRYVITGKARRGQHEHPFDIKAEVDAVTGDEAAQAGYRAFVAQHPGATIMVNGVMPAEVKEPAPPPPDKPKPQTKKAA
jgi:hypothetical protein